MGSIPNFDHIHEDVFEPLSPSLTRSKPSPIELPEQHANPIRVAVVGGGIGGLSLALGLLQHAHLDVQVYEAAHKFSEIGAGIGVGPNTERALELLGPKVYAAYMKIATRAPFKLRNGCDGKDAGKSLLPENVNASQSSVHRAHFLDEFSALVPPEKAHFGKRLVYLEDNTKEGDCFVLHFKDETTVEADAVFGADGIHSHVREYILGDAKDQYEPTYTGWTGYRNLLPMEKVIAEFGADFAHTANVFMLEKYMSMTYPVDHYQKLNVLGYTSDFPEWTNKDWVIPVETEKVLTHFHGQAEILTKLIKLFDRPSAWALWDLPSLPRYNRNRVCITGDAAHATLPFQGQGAGQAIEDAVTLTKLMGEVKSADEISFAFAAYDTVRRPRGNKIVTTSRETGQIVTMQDPTLQDMDKIGEIYPDRFVWIWGKDITKQSQDAIDLFVEYKAQA